MLLHGLFAPGAQLSQDEHGAHLDLLALAAAAIDDRYRVQHVELVLHACNDFFCPASMKHKAKAQALLPASQPYHVEGFCP